MLLENQNLDFLLLLEELAMMLDSHIVGVFVVGNIVVAFVVLNVLFVNVVIVDILVVVYFVVVLVVESNLVVLGYFVFVLNTLLFVDKVVVSLVVVVLNNLLILNYFLLDLNFPDKIFQKNLNFFFFHIVVFEVKQHFYHFYLCYNYFHLNINFFLHINIYKFLLTFE